MEINRCVLLHGGFDNGNHNPPLEACIDNIANECPLHKRDQ